MLQRPATNYVPLQGTLKQTRSAQRLTRIREPRLQQRRAFKAAVPRPRWLPDFEEAEALDEKLFGKKIQLGEKTIDELLTVTDSKGNKKKINIGAAHLALKDNLAVIKHMVTLNMTESQDDRVALGTRLTDMFNGMTTEMKSMGDANQQVIDKAINELGISRDYKKEFNGQRLFDSREVKANQGRLSLWLIATRGNLDMNTPLHSKNRKGDLVPIGIHSLSNMHQKKRVLDLGQRALINMTEALQLVAAGAAAGSAGPP